MKALHYGGLAVAGLCLLWVVATWVAALAMIAAGHGGGPVPEWLPRSFAAAVLVGGAAVALSVLGYVRGRH